jgi:exonuclease VII small subunit
VVNAVAQQPDVEKLRALKLRNLREAQDELQEHIHHLEVELAQLEFTSAYARKRQAEEQLKAARARLKSVDTLVSMYSQAASSP